MSRSAPAPVIATGVEDDPVEPGQERRFSRNVGAKDLDEDFLYGIVNLFTVPLKEEDASHLGSVPPEELGARLRLLPAQSIDEAVRQFVYRLPPR